jgi:hypothetical protein
VCCCRMILSEYRWAVPSTPSALDGPNQGYAAGQKATAAGLLLQRLHFARVLLGVNKQCKHTPHASALGGGGDTWQTLCCCCAPSSTTTLLVADTTVFRTKHRPSLAWYSWTFRKRSCCSCAALAVCACCSSLCVERSMVPAATM